MKIIILIFLTASSSALAELSDMNPFTDEYIDYINSKQDSWTAGRNFPADTDFKLFKQKFGVHEAAMKERLQERKAPNPDIVLGSHFDARVAWPDCDTINEIRDQSNCEGCWAFGPAEVISDRICIHSDDNEVVRISPQELIECCTECTKGQYCMPGSFIKAWNYWKRNGLVTGGDYNDTQTCLPFDCPPCTNTKTKTCRINRFKEDRCTKKCQSNYGVNFEDDKYYGLEIYSVPANEQDIMEEIMVNGPVQAAITVYYDFAAYKNGVYINVDKRIYGHHAMKIIGWGEEKRKPYWLVANSQGLSFGMGGFMKIRRGQNECEIESHVHAGFPKQRNRRKTNILN